MSEKNGTRVTFTTGTHSMCVRLVSPKHSTEMVTVVSSWKLKNLKRLILVYPYALSNVIQYVHINIPKM